MKNSILNPYELVIKACQDLELLITEELAAEGRNFTEKLKSIESQLSERTYKSLRRMISIRVKVVNSALELNSVQAKRFEAEYCRLKAALLEVAASKLEQESLTAQVLESDSSAVESKTIESETKTPETESKTPETESKTPEAESKTPEAESKTAKSETKLTLSEAKSTESLKPTPVVTITEEARFPVILFLAIGLIILLKFSAVGAAFSLAWMLILYFLCQVFLKWKEKPNPRWKTWLAIWLIGLSPLITFMLMMPGEETSIKAITSEVIGLGQKKIQSKEKAKQDDRDQKPEEEKASTIKSPSKKDLEIAEKKAENTVDQVVRLFHDRAIVKLSKPEFKYNQDGTYDVLVEVKWNLEPHLVSDLLKSVLNFKESDTNGVLSFKKTDNQGGYQLQPYSSDIYEYLAKQKVKLKIQLGEHSDEITLLTGRNCFMGCEGEGDSEVQIQYSNQNNPKALLYTSFLGEQNPLVLEHVSKEELLKADVIKAYITSVDEQSKIGQYELEQKMIPDELAASEQQQKQAFTTLQKSLFEYIGDSITITHEDPVSHKNEDGSYDASVDVRWSYDSAPIFKALNLYFDIPDILPRTDLLRIKKSDNSKEKQKQPFSQDLYELLAQYQAGIKITWGKQERKITFASGLNCFLGCKGRGDTEFHFLLSNQNSPGDLLFAPSEGQQNPVEFKGLSKKELDEPVSVEYFWKKVKLVSTPVENQVD